MATQYTAGLSSGDVLTAATMNSIGAAWETWTPTITSSAGTLTTVTTNIARYTRIQKLVIAQIDFTITTIGTGTGVPLFTFPITGKSFTGGGAIGVYREQANTGLMGNIAFSSTTQGLLYRYDNANHLAANNRYIGTFTYEGA